MTQFPYSHGDAISQFRQENEAPSTPNPGPLPRQNCPTRLTGSLWRAGMVIGIWLILLVSGGAAAAAQPSPAPEDKAAAAVNLRTPLQSVLYILRDAIVQKDFDKYVSVYARVIRGNNMVRYWDRFDTIKQEVTIDKIESIDPDNAIAFVTWNSKTRDQRTGKVSSDTNSERIMFTRKKGKWLILPDEDVP
jgi:hypothetical protein